MSYQFEDDSALEELLNQQLDRRKQQPIASFATPIRPSTTRSAQVTTTNQATSSPRPSTAISNPVINDKSTLQTSVLGSATVSRGKLASWLDGKSSDQGAPDAEVAPRAQDTEKRDVVLKPFSDGAIIEDKLSEDQLQEMSKQRLIKLITSEIIPTLKDLRNSSAHRSEEAVSKLENELEFERSKNKALEMRHLEQMRLTESRWAQLNKQLESRLELSEQEVRLVAERYRSIVVDLEDEHKQQIDKLKDNYQTRLAQEKLQLEETLKRREDLHNLELESKLKVNCDLTKLETVFDGWHTMIQTTIRQLDLQFRSVESLLDKQTTEINGSNTELARKSKELSEHYDKFEHQSGLLNTLAQEFNEILPRFSRIQQENESLAKQTAGQVDEFLKRHDQAQAREKDLERLREEVAREKARLAEERFELALSSNRVDYKEERFTELMKANEVKEKALASQRHDQIERDARLVALQASLDAKSNELKQQNYDLHLTRRKLIDDTEKLSRSQVELDKERNTVQERSVRVQNEARKLGNLRERVSKELNQLKRLQKSLVCSLCLDRLFKTDPPGSLNHQALQSINRNKWPQNVPGDLIIGKDNQGPEARDPTTYYAHHDLMETNFEVELANLNRYMEKDSKKLEVENKYVELLTT